MSEISLHSGRKSYINRLSGALRANRLFKLSRLLDTYKQIDRQTSKVYQISITI